MAASSSDKFKKLSRRWVGQIGSGGVSDDTTGTIPLSSATNLPSDTAVVAVIDRVDSNGDTTASLEETVIGVVSGSNLTSCTRGAEGTAQAHSAGAVVEILVTAKGWNDIVNGVLVDHDQSGQHKNLTDANGNEWIKQTATASAVNEFTLANAAADTNPKMSATGGDTNIGLDFQSKGTGVYRLLGTADTAAEARLFEDTDNGANYIGLKAPAAVTGNKTFVLPDGDGSANQVLKTDGSGNLGWVSQSSNTDGWVDATAETWSYASATTFTVSGDKTAQYRPGTKIKLTQTSVKYFVVVASSYSAPNTTVTVTGGTDYSVANAAISANYYSYQECPQNYPAYFNYTPTLGAAGSMTLSSTSIALSRFTTHGRECRYYLRFAGTIGGTPNVALTFTTPIAQNSASDSNYATGIRLRDGDNTNIAGLAYSQDTANWYIVKHTIANFATGASCLVSLVVTFDF